MALTKAHNRMIEGAAVNVKDFGAVGDGVTDDTAAFSAACAAVETTINFDNHGIARAESGVIHVPAGSYNLGSLVDASNKDICYELEAGAKIINPDNMNGRFVRNGRAYRAPDQVRFGSEDQAVGFSVTVGKGGNEGAEILGVTDENQVGEYVDRDAVAFFSEIVGEDPLATVTNCTFASTSVTLGTSLTADQIKKLRVGMLIDTNHSPQKYTGWITGWASDGTSINVEGWYLVDGSAGSPATPSSPATIYVNPVTKIWAVNSNVTLASYSHADFAAAAEFGIFDQKAAATQARGGTHYAWGVDSVNLGTYKAQALFLARGETAGSFVGYRADQVDNALWIYSTTPSSSYAVTANDGTTDRLFIRNDGDYTIRNASNQVTYNLTSSGNIEMGNHSASNTPFIDFRSSGAGSDYDARIIVNGGSASTGQGNLDINAANVGVNANALSTTTALNVGSNGGQFGGNFITLGDSTASASWRASTGSFHLNFLQNDGTGTYVQRSYITNATGVYVAVSDQSQKHTVESLGNSLATVNQLNPVSFYYNGQDESDQKSLGLIAQEVQSLVPEVVHESDELLGINYAGLVPVLIKAIQELSAKVEALENP